MRSTSQCVMQMWGLWNNIWTFNCYSTESHSTKTEDKQNFPLPSIRKGIWNSSSFLWCVIFSRLNRIYGNYANLNLLYFLSVLICWARKWGDEQPLFRVYQLMMKGTTGPGMLNVRVLESSWGWCLLQETREHISHGSWVPNTVSRLLQDNGCNQD